MQETKETQLQSVDQEDSLEEGMAAHTSILISHGQRSLVGYSPWGHRESDMTEVTEHTHMHICNLHNIVPQPYFIFRKAWIYLSAVKNEHRKEGKQK